MDISVRDSTFIHWLYASFLDRWMELCTLFEVTWYEAEIWRTFAPLMLLPPFLKTNMSQ